MPAARHSVMVRVANVDEHYARVMAAGATISGVPASMRYGELLSADLP
jgi:hypothetical protein